MKEKTFNVFACKMTVDNMGANTTLTKSQLQEFLDTIKQLPVDLSLGTDSRYKKDKSCLIFVDELQGAFKNDPNFLPAIYISRRDSKPLEDDGKGNLQSVELASEENQIAEVCYVIFSLENSVLYWIHNPMVGGLNNFADYLAKIYIRSCSVNQLDNNLLPETASIVMNYVKYPETHNDYNNNSFLPTSLEFNIALGRAELEQGDLFSTGDGAGVELLRHFHKNSNCGRIHLEITAPKYKPSKKHPTSRPFLDKKFISKFFEDIQCHLNENDKFMIKGYDVDETTKMLDFIGERLVYPFKVQYDSKMLAVMDVLPKYESFAKKINPKINSYLEGGQL